MKREVCEGLGAQGGVASVGQMGRLGVSSQTVDRLVRSGALVRLRRDVIIDAQVWSEAQPWDKHALRARAVMHSLNPNSDRSLALSHHSALAVHGLSIFGGDDRVHLVRTDAQRGRSDAVVQVHAPIAPSSVQVVQGLPVVVPALAALQMAGSFGACAGLVAADSALHVGVCSEGDLACAAQNHNFGAGIKAVRLVAAIADARIESAGESRARWVMRSCGFPDPVPQVLIRTGFGFAARVDFLFPAQWTVVEFDGMLKYQTAADAQQEKVREDRLRAMGYEVVRLTWDDLRHPDRVRHLISAAFERAARSRAS